MTRRRHRRTTKWRPVPASLALLMLTACANNAAIDPAGRQTTEAAAQSIAPKQQPAPHPQAAAAPAVPINDDPAQIVGMAPSEVDDLLGAPVRVRRDGGAEIRQYRADTACQLDAFVYQEAKGFRVTHVELRNGPERLDASTARACLRRMLTRPGTS